MAKMKLESSSIVHYYRSVSENAQSLPEPPHTDRDAWRKWAFSRLCGQAAVMALRERKWWPTDVDDRVQIAQLSLHRQLQRNIVPERGIASAWSYAKLAIDHALVVEGEKGMFGTARNKRVKFRALVQSGMSEEEAGEASELASIMRINRLVDVTSHASDDGKETPYDEAISAASADATDASSVEDAALLGYETGIVRDVLFSIVEDETISFLIREIARIVYIEGSAGGAKDFIEAFRQPDPQTSFSFIDGPAKSVKTINIAQYAYAHSLLVEVVRARLSEKRRVT